MSAPTTSTVRSPFSRSAWTREGRVGWPIEGTSTRTSLTGDLSVRLRAATRPWAGAYPPTRRRLARYNPVHFAVPVPRVGPRSRADGLRQRAAETADLLQ